MSVENIRRCYDSADSIDRAEGQLAYQLYHDSLYAIAKYYHVGFCQTVAAFAALSPNNDYVGNMRSLISVIEGFLSQKDIDEITISTYNACRNRAYLFLSGEADFLISTKGKKTQAFYHNIINPNCNKHVTIDGHMYGVYQGVRLKMVEVARLKIPYEQIAADFKSVAKQLHMLPNQLQAILWFAQKRNYAVIYNPQLSLLDHADGTSDPWGLRVDPLSFRPF